MAKKLSHNFCVSVCMVMVIAIVSACGEVPPQVAERPPESSEATDVNTSASTDSADTDSEQSVSDEGVTDLIYNEAPELAERVESDDLPPVDERLPVEPMVVEPTESVGAYGGEWRMGMLGASDDFFLFRTIGYEGLVRWDNQWEEIIPNIASAWEISPDGKEVTFYLREGTRWSDGEPFTADDIVFWYEDIIMNEEITTGESPGPGWFRPGGETGKVVKVDDYTFKMQFVAPVGLLLQEISADDAASMLVPAHYAKQFHKDYNPEVVQMAEEQNLSSWVELFQLNVTNTPGQDSRWFNAERPTLNAWMVTTPIGEGQQVTAVRNPYYWKVDTEGNQLPYIDRVVYEVAENRDVLILKALNGEINMQSRHINAANNKAVYFDNQEEGEYGFYEILPSEMNMLVISFNMNNKDPVLRELFREKNFRIAMSHAINREEISAVAYAGLGEPWQTAPLPQSPFYRESMAKQYTEFDLDTANQLLDDLGLERGPDGIRMRSDGQPLRISVEVRSDATDRLDALQLVTKTWREVGVDLEINAVERALFRTRTQAYEYDIATSGGNGGMDVMLSPRFYFPFEDKSYFGIAWADWWNSDGEQGEEPIPIAKEQQELYDQIRVTADPAEQEALMNQILDIAEEQFWSIGTIAWPPAYGIVRNDFKNVPATMFESSVWPDPGPTNPEQYYIEQ